MNATRPVGPPPARWGLTALIVLLCPAAGSAEDKPDDLTRRAVQILKANCHRCHGGDGSNEGGMDYILDLKKLVAKKKLVPGNVEKSKILQRVKDGNMPPEDETPRPSEQDIATLEEWVKAGIAGDAGPGRPAEAKPEGKPPVADAATDAAKPREFRGEKDVLEAVLAHLRKTPAADRRFTRYFTLTNLHNNPGVTAGDLRLYRAALSKTVNSMSWQPDVVLPEAVDPDGIVLAVDLRQLGWDRHQLWHRILTAYPYGVRHDESADRGVRELAKEVYLLSGSEVPALRADWFVATATQPPLYYDLLRLPKHAGELEQLLRVDVGRNIARNQAARAGFTTSGISRQNRMVERHPAAHGAYWKSYDFLSNDGAGNLFRFPLGPVAATNPYPEQAFVHDGGEMIFHLPNGLQGYYLADGKDRRIDVGPIEVVRDRTETSGSVAIVNGVSCMACHSKGMIDFTDAVRLGHGLGGQLRAKVEDLYPEADAMQRLVQKDQRRFVAALEEATQPFGPFLNASDKPVASVLESKSEPIGKLARLYLLTEVDAAMAAAELGFKDAAELVACVKSNPDLRAMGLGPLATGAKIKRQVWHSTSGFVSAYQQAAQRLELGTPVRVR